MKKFSRLKTTAKKSLNKANCKPFRSRCCDLISANGTTFGYSLAFIIVYVFPIPITLHYFSMLFNKSLLDWTTFYIAVQLSA